MRKTATKYIYAYRFKSLSFGGLMFGNPELEIFDNGRVGRGDETTRTLLIGLHELRKLHLLISYKEKLIYATAVDAH